jgi:hypothetical protein
MAAAPSSARNRVIARAVTMPYSRIVNADVHCTVIGTPACAGAAWTRANEPDAAFDVGPALPG